MASDSPVYNPEYSPLSALYNVRLQRRHADRSSPRDAVTSRGAWQHSSGVQRDRLRTPVKFLSPQRTVVGSRTTNSRITQRHRPTVDGMRGRRRSVTPAWNTRSRSVTPLNNSATNTESAGRRYHNCRGARDLSCQALTRDAWEPSSALASSSLAYTASSARSTPTHESNSTRRSTNSWGIPLSPVDPLIDFNHPSIPRELQPSTNVQRSNGSPKKVLRVSAPTESHSNSQPKYNATQQLASVARQKGGLYYGDRDTHSTVCIPHQGGPTHDVDKIGLVGLHHITQSYTPNPANCSQRMEFTTRNGCAERPEDSTAESLSEDVVFQRLHPNTFLPHTGMLSSIGIPETPSVSSSEHTSNFSNRGRPSSPYTTGPHMKKGLAQAGPPPVEQRDAIFWEKWFSLRGWSTQIASEDQHEEGTQAPIDVTDDDNSNNNNNNNDLLVNSTMQSARCSSRESNNVHNNSAGRRLITSPDDTTCNYVMQRNPFDTVETNEQAANSPRPLFHFEPRLDEPCRVPLYDDEASPSAGSFKTQSHETHSRPAKIAATMRAYLTFLKSPDATAEEAEDTEMQTQESTEAYSSSLIPSPGAVDVTKGSDNRSLNTTPKTSCQASPSTTTKSSSQVPIKNEEVSSLADLQAILLPSFAAKENNGIQGKLHPLLRQAWTDKTLTQATPSVSAEDKTDNTKEYNASLASKHVVKMDTGSTMTTSSTGPLHNTLPDTQLQPCEFPLTENTEGSFTAPSTTSGIPDDIPFIPHGCTPRPDPEHRVQFDDPIPLAEENSETWDDGGDWSTIVQLSSSSENTQFLKDPRPLSVQHENIPRELESNSDKNDDADTRSESLRCSLRISNVRKQTTSSTISMPPPCTNNGIWPRWYAYPLLEDLTFTIREQLRGSRMGENHEPEDYKRGIMVAASTLSLESCVPTERYLRSIRRLAFSLLGWSLCCVCAATFPSWLALSHTSLLGSAFVRLCVSSTIYWILCLVSVLLFVRKMIITAHTYERRWAQHLCQRFCTSPLTLPMVPFVMRLPWDHFTFRCICACYNEKCFFASRPWIKYIISSLTVLATGLSFPFIFLGSPLWLSSLASAAWVLHFLLACIISGLMFLKILGLQRRAPITPISSLYAVNATLGLLELMASNEKRTLMEEIPNNGIQEDVRYEAVAYMSPRTLSTETLCYEDVLQSAEPMTDLSMHPSFESPCPWWWVYQDYLRFHYGGIVVSWSPVATESSRINNRKAKQQGLLYLWNGTQSKKPDRLKPLKKISGDNPLGIFIYEAQPCRGSSWCRLSLSFALSCITAISTPKRSTPTSTCVKVSGYPALTDKNDHYYQGDSCLQQLETVLLELQGDEGLALYRLTHSFM